MKRRNRRPLDKKQRVEFEIDHIDPLGQGVSKKAGKVTFIAGTLPGETGTAMVYKRARGVQFAQLEKLETIAENRIEPVCPHFDRCPGCQFLHTDYESELGYKATALSRHLSGLGVNIKDIEVVPAPRRLSYRNRVQLHYRHQYIGMLDTIKNEILEVPHCRVMRKELEPAFAELQNGDWTREHSGHGHCELYFRSQKVGLEWNKEYSHGGFSQVFEEMNVELQARVQSQLETLAVGGVLDLFSGDGNLSGAFAAHGGHRILIDSFMGASGPNKPDHFHQMDLYDEQTLANFTRKVDVSEVDTLLIDPPRKGFPALGAWIKKIKVRFLVYVSCNPASLARDLRSLGVRYRFSSVQLLDLFPATSHFETLVVLEVLKGNPKPSRAKTP